MDECVAKEHAFRFVHAEVDRKDLINTPFLHRTPNQNSTRLNFILSIGLTLQRRTHLANRDLVCGVDTTLYQVTRDFRLQAFRRVIRLFGPLVFDELNASPVNDDEFVVLSAEHNKSRPA
jgi:hypothetical protein